MNLKYNSLLKQSIYLIMIITMTSCAKIPVLFKTSESSKEQNETVLNQFFKAKDPILQPGDKITMSIWGHDDLSIGSVNSIYSSSEETGKWITLDKDGEANLPKIGRIKLSGYNLKEVNYILEQKYSSQLKDPIINVRVLNHYVTVLGEVNKPGKYQLDNEKITLVQIIGTAQGFNNYANSRVKLVRIVNNAPVELFNRLYSTRFTCRLQCSATTR